MRYSCLLHHSGNRRAFGTLSGFRAEKHIYIVAVDQSLIMSNSATPWTVAHRLPCPSLSPGVFSDSCLYYISYIYI